MSSLQASKSDSDFFLKKSRTQGKDPITWIKQKYRNTVVDERNLKSATVIDSDYAETQDPIEDDNFEKNEEYKKFQLKIKLMGRQKGMAHENPVNEVLINKISKSMKVADSNKSTFIKEGQNMYRNANVEIIEFGKSKLMNEIQDRAEKVGKKELLKTWTKGLNQFEKETIQLLKKTENSSKILGMEHHNYQMQIEKLKEELILTKQKNQKLQFQLEQHGIQMDQYCIQNQNLQIFKEYMEKMKKRFPQTSLDKLMDRFEILEGQASAMAQKMGSLEGENAQYRLQIKQLQASLEANKIEYQKQNQEISKKVVKYKCIADDIIHESQMKRQDTEYKDRYLDLQNQILNLYNKWQVKLKVFGSQKYSKNEIMPSPDLSSPLEVIETLDKMIRISTPLDIQEYLRKIIISANQLIRKFCPELVNFKFEPDKIYDGISHYITEQNQTIQGLKNQIERMKRGDNISPKKSNKLNVIKEIDLGQLQ